MKMFHVYHHPLLKYEAVKVGASWPALFFGILWMVGKRLWNWVLLWLILIFFLAAMQGDTTLQNQSQDVFESMFIMLANLALWFIPVIYGNTWRESNLRNRGYTFKRAIYARNVDEALSKFINEYYRDIEEVRKELNNE